MDKSLFSILDGVIVNESAFMFVGLDDERASAGIKHGLVWKLKGETWSSVEIGESLVSCTFTPNPDYRFVAIAESGRELVIGDNALNQELVATGADAPESNGPLTRVKLINNDEIYAVGTARQAYKKQAADSWVRIDQSCKSSDGDVRASTAFMDVDGFGSNEIYAVGWEGEIWRYDGRCWTQLDSPTNLILHSLHCASDGYVYICGQKGLLIKGRHNKWELIEQADTQEDLRSICYFNKNIYVCSSNIIYRLLEGGLDIVKMEKPVASAGILKANGGYLISIGLKDIVIFDDNDWTVLL